MQLATSLSPFSTRLMAAQERAGLTTEALARQLDVTVRVVQKWRSGETEPGGRNLVRLAAVLRVRPESFYDDANESGHEALERPVAETPTRRP